MHRWPPRSWFYKFVTDLTDGRTGAQAHGRTAGTHLGMAGLFFGISNFNAKNKHSGSNTPCLFSCKWIDNYICIEIFFFEGGNPCPLFEGPRPPKGPGRSYLKCAPGGRTDGQSLSLSCRDTLSKLSTHPLTSIIIRPKTTIFLGFFNERVIDRRTDRRMHRPSGRDTRTHLKRVTSLKVIYTDCEFSL